MANPILIPTPEQITELRTMFFEKLDKEGAPSGVFHAKDVSRVRKSDMWLQRFLEHNDLDLKKSLKQLWDTCEWRQTFGSNDICESNINMDYVNLGDCFPHNHDIEGKPMLIYKSILHVKGKRDGKELIRIFVYWMERLQRSSNFEPVTIFFDLAGCGLKNLDLDYTISVVNILKTYYPNSVNYILIYEMPWVLSAGIKIIKSLLPPKAVSSMKFIDSKNIREYISEDCMLASWGGTDEYTFRFEPEADTNKQVRFASLTDSPLSDKLVNDSLIGKTGEKMLKVNPPDAITFTKADNELVGMFEIKNIVQESVTYKIKTTAPEKFRVRPSTGVLQSGASTVINVVLLQGYQMPVLTKDKFLVMCMELESDSGNTSQDIVELWKNTANSSSQVELHRLKCCPSQSAQSLNESDSMENGRQISTMVTKLLATTKCLECQIKFNHKLQWATLVIVVLLSVAVVYILKMEIKNVNEDYCPNVNRKQL